MVSNGDRQRQAAPRLSFSSARTTSTATTLTSALEQNDTEAYSGAGFEAVPSSIVSFHHPQSLQSSHLTERAAYRGHRVPEIEPLVSSPNSHARSRSNSVREQRFRFFSQEQLSRAEGAATLDHTDYNTEWDYEPEYAARESVMGSRRSSFRTQSAQSSLSNFSYGSQNVNSKPLRRNPADSGLYTTTSRNSSSSLSRYSIRERIPSELETQSVELEDERSTSRSLPSVDSNEESQQNRSDAGSRYEDQHIHNKKNIEFLKPKYHAKFYPGHPVQRDYQRFYISEEDLLIGLAGYSTSKIKYRLYQFLCILTCGLFYLLLRWLPQYKIRFYGVKTPLGQAEWVVIENEFGEITIEDVQRQWYNRPLSTVLNLPIDDVEYQEDGAHYDLLSHPHHTSEKNPNISILIKFSYRYITFIYSPLEDIYRTNNNWTDPEWLDLHNCSRGLSAPIVDDRTLAFDKNQINLKIKSTSQILFDEVLHPFYIFQVFSIVLWSLDQYYYYATCILLISVLSIMNTLIETKKVSRTLAEMSYFSCDVRVLREEFWTSISSFELVPGDIYEVSDPSLTMLPCDSILLSGDCIVNESMLTGESVPVSKSPANEETILQLLEDFRNTQISNYTSKSLLFNGTTIIRARIPHGQSAALAMVVRTGFSSTKGSLVRSMVFPKPTGFKFYEDSFKYIGFMSLIALIGFLISCIQFIRIHLDKRTMILRAFDIITIVVPPALPASLTIGTSFALSRLKKKGIFCIAPTRVNVGGKIDIMTFDKTGTLTEDGLDVMGVMISEPHSKSSYAFGTLLDDIHKVFGKFSLKDCASSTDVRYRNMLMALLTCHSLRMVDGELLGDPLDFKMFQFTGWSFEEDFQKQPFHSMYEERHEKGTFPENVDIIPAVVHPNGNDPMNKFTDNDPNNFLGIIRSFEFLAELRRMSVIVKPNNEDVYFSFTKGAPEVIEELCIKSTLPHNFDETLHHFTHKGYRIIACAGKTLPKRTWLHSQKVSREEIESNLEFFGFIVFQNKLKDATNETLRVIQKANIRTVMCTGDNVLTSVSVGRECGLFDNSRVYIPHIEQHDATDLFNIVWREISNPELILDDNTLKCILPADSNLDPDDYTLAVTGDAFRRIFRHESEFSETYINQVLLRSSIFARMSPDEKHELMEQFQKLDYTVGFCGDGANDCGALKAADVGISLSEAEASVAAPFTSKIFDISCVLDVMKEGRAALVTSFACFQYMSLYSAIQFITVTILYSRGSNLGDFQFLYIDLMLIVPIAVFISWSEPYHELVAKRPSANLVSNKILIPLVTSILIIIFFQLVPWLEVQKEAWYIKPVVGGDDVVQSSDNTVLFFVSNFQYILTAVILSVGPPYREPVLKNTGFVIDIVVSLLMSSLLMFLNTDSYLGNLLQLTPITTKFKLFIMLWVVINYFVQLYVPALTKGWFKKRQSSKKYKNFMRQEQHSRHV